MVRILCLHGMGSNEQIFRVQLTSFMEAMGSSHEFVFLDGEIECEAAPGVDHIAPGPYFCYYNSFSTAKILQAHEQIWAFIEDDGPFDGVVGFSQGSALAASILLHRNLASPWEAPPFNFAILFSGNSAFSPDHALYLDAIREWMSAQDSAPEPSSGTTNSSAASVETDSVQRHFLNSPMVQQILRDLSDNPSSDTTNMKMLMHSLQADPFAADASRLYHPQFTTARVRVPTLHVIGKQDPFASQAHLTYNLCASGERKLIEHEGGHHVPREKHVIASVVHAAATTIERSMLVASGALL